MIYTLGIANKGQKIPKSTNKSLATYPLFYLCKTSCLRYVYVKWRKVGEIVNKGGGIMNNGVRIVNLKASENSSIQTRIIELDILICFKMEAQ